MDIGNEGYIDFMTGLSTVAFIDPPALNFMAYAARLPARPPSYWVLKHMAWMDVFLDLKQPQFDLRRCERGREQRNRTVVFYFRT